jgi:hypothetical protein
VNQANIARAMARPARLSTAERFEIAVLVLILLAVGLAAGAGSFTHVHDWTMHNSPPATGDWFGWANAVISELVPVASLLVMRRRKRAGQPVGYPMFLLITALALSITAQLAVAKPGVTGAVVSVIPALAFAALAKLILGKAPTPEAVIYQPNPVPRPMPQTVPVYEPAADISKDRPRVSEPEEHHEPTAIATVAATTPAISQPTFATAAPLPTQLLERARHAAHDHLATHGRTITRDELRAVLRISNSTTGDLMRALGLSDPARPSANGTTAVSPLTGKPLLPTS